MYIYDFILKKQKHWFFMLQMLTLFNVYAFLHDHNDWMIWLKLNEFNQDFFSHINRVLQERVVDVSDAQCVHSHTVLRGGLIHTWGW